MDKISIFQQFNNYLEKHNIKKDKEKLSIFDNHEEFNSFIKENYGEEDSIFSSDYDVIKNYKYEDGQFLINSEDEEIEGDIIADFLNNIMADEDFIDSMDTNQNNKLDEEEIRSFLDLVKELDGNGEDISIADLTEGITFIKEALAFSKGEDVEIGIVKEDKENKEDKKANKNTNASAKKITVSSQPVSKYSNSTGKSTGSIRNTAVTSGLANNSKKTNTANSTKQTTTNNTNSRTVATTGNNVAKNVTGTTTARQNTTNNTNSTNNTATARNTNSRNLNNTVNTRSGSPYIGTTQSSATANLEQKDLKNLKESELNSELKKEEKKLDENETKLNDIEAGKEESVKTAKEKTEEAYEKYQEELKKLDTELAEKLDNAVKEIETKENEITEKENEISEQKTTISQAETDYANATIKREGLEKSLSELEGTNTEDLTDAEKAKLNIQIMTLKTQIGNAKQEEENAKNKVEEEKEKLTKLEEEKKALESELESAKENKTAVEEEISEKHSEVQEYMDEYNNAKAAEEETKNTAINTTQTEITNTNQNIDKIKQELQELKFDKEKEVKESDIKSLNTANTTANTNATTEKTTNSKYPLTFDGYDSTKGTSLVNSANSLYGDKGLKDAQGLCGQGVRKSIESAYGYSLYGNGNQWGSLLENRSDWKEVTSEVSASDLKNLPAGAVVSWSAYNGGQYGHVCISDGNGNEISDAKYTMQSDYYLNRGGSYRVFIPC